MRLLSVSWSCISGLHYTRGITLYSVGTISLGCGKSCISRFCSGIRLKLFLTSLLKQFEENLTLTLLIKLERVLLHGHITKVELIWI